MNYDIPIVSFTGLLRFQKYNLQSIKLNLYIEYKLINNYYHNTYLQ